MNRSEKVAHLRKLADALEEERVILSSGNIAAYDEADGSPRLSDTIWNYKPKPKMVELWVNVYPQNNCGQAWPTKGFAESQRMDCARTIHMIEVEHE